MLHCSQGAVGEKAEQSLPPCLYAACRRRGVFRNFNCSERLALPFLPGQTLLSLPLPSSSLTLLLSFSVAPMGVHLIVLTGTCMKRTFEAGLFCKGAWLEGFDPTEDGLTIRFIRYSLLKPHVLYVNSVLRFSPRGGVAVIKCCAVMIFERSLQVELPWTYEAMLLFLSLLSY